MKSKFILILYLIVISCSTSNNIDVSSINKKNKFIKIDIIELSSNNEIIDFQLQLKIPTNKLIFNKNINGFNSNISIDAIFIKDNKIILNESWNHEVFVDYFEDTNIKKDIIIDKVLSLPLGTYKVDLIVNDYQNHISWHKETNIELNDNFKMSDILLYKKTNNRFSIASDDELEDLDTLWVQYQFNNLTDFNSYMDIQYDFFYIQDVKNKGSIELNNVYIDEDVIYKNNNRIFIDRNGINYYPIEIIEDFFNGLVIKIIYNDNYRYRTILLDRYKEIDYNFENIVGPMEYILESSNFKKYREYIQLTIEDKISYIKTYWNLDSIEEGTSNKLFKEFYKRVQHTNRNFKYLSTDGWLTDRGKIYIIYGEPLQIKEEYTTEGQYKIWIYKNNKQFIFYNRYGPYVLIDTN
tara:strand:+ start:1920 stop:3146 length:1227 start_codon:yes stop_codon:yes gene_type:complete